MLAVLDILATSQNIIQVVWNFRKSKGLSLKLQKITESFPLHQNSLKRHCALLPCFVVYHYTGNFTVLMYFARDSNYMMTLME